MAVTSLLPAAGRRLAEADRGAFEAVRDRRTNAGIMVARAVSALAEPRVVYPLLAVTGVVAAVREGSRPGRGSPEWWRAGAPCAAVAAGAVARRQVAEAIARPRPPREAWLAVPEGFSLPSRHTTIAVLAAGAAVRALGVRGAPARAVRLLAAAGVGSSRVYLGVHWPGDVVAGWLFAECWLRLTRESDVEGVSHRAASVVVIGWAPPGRRSVASGRGCLPRSIYSSSVRPH